MLILNAPRRARFTTTEWDAYIAAGMAIQNERGALSLAHKQGYEDGYEKGEEKGEENGEKKGLLLGIEALCDAFAIDLNVERKRELQTLDAAGLQALMAKLKAERRWP